MEQKIQMHWWSHFTSSILNNVAFYWNHIAISTRAPWADGHSMNMQEQITLMLMLFQYYFLYVDENYECRKALLCCED